MSSSNITNLERNSLEVHVDLCADRFRNLQEEVGTVNERISKLEADMAKRMDKLETGISEIKETLVHKETSALRTLITVGISVITALMGVSGGLLWYIITK